jgi:hypothetical protein
MMERVNSSMIHCKNFCKCHHVFQVQQSYDNVLKRILVPPVLG